MYCICCSIHYTHCAIFHQGFGGRSLRGHCDGIPRLRCLQDTCVNNVVSPNPTQSEPRRERTTNDGEDNKEDPQPTQGAKQKAGIRINKKIGIKKEINMEAREEGEGRTQGRKARKARNEGRKEERCFMGKQ